ncbi:MAG: sulfotransferase [Acidimicrobiales bacterium]|nr:sulfotransferase [Acidimicrobiales bacterium]
MEVIGAGWGRTGTLSTKIALERLGLGPCYHMIEVFRTHPEHRSLWRRAAAGEQVEWSEIFSEYRSAVDWPTCAFWRELAEAYPQAKVLLTYRPGRDWYESFDATISDGIPRRHPGDGDETGAMMNEVIVQRSFLNRAGSRDELVDRYEEHVAEVREALPAERLLVWSPKEGWEPLCEFLDVSTPAEPFPQVNDRADFDRIFAGGEGEVEG